MFLLAGKAGRVWVEVPGCQGEMRRAQLQAGGHKQVDRNNFGNMSGYFSLLLIVTASEDCTGFIRSL